MKPGQNRATKAWLNLGKAFGGGFFDHELHKGMFANSEWPVKPHFAIGE
jgi:hypothetical protein